MRKFVLLGLGGVVIAVVVLVLRYTVFLDLAGYELNLVFRADHAAYARAGSALHRGEGPCLRYTDAHETSDEHAEAIARELFAAGVDRSTFGDLLGTYVEWIEELERPLHQADKVDEHIALISRDSLGAALVLRLNRSRVRENTERAMLSHRQRAAAATARITAEQLATVRAAFDRNPLAFTVSGALRVMHAYSGITTEAKLDTLAAYVEGVVKSGQPAPTMLHGLPGLPPDAHEDGWTSHFEIKETETGYRIWSNGADRTEGGEGPNRDYVREIVLRAPPAPPAPKPCEPLRPDVTFSRADVDSVLTNLSEVAYSARVVPHLVQGRVVGFRVEEIQDSSPYKRLGLCDGDIVLSMAGFDLTAPDKALAAYETFSTATEIPIRVRRADVEADVIVHITP